MIVMINTNIYAGVPEEKRSLGKCRRDWTKTCGHPGQANNWCPFKLIYFKHLSTVQQFNIFPIYSSYVLMPLIGWHPRYLLGWLSP
jgi:hypothetical protein